MSRKEVLKFAEGYVEESILRILEKLIDINVVDIDFVVVITNKYSINNKCFEYFIGDMNNSEDNITASHIDVPKLHWIFKKF